MISQKAIFELAAALGGIPVLGALAGSPAARAGIRYGDVVLAVNNRRTRTMFDYLEAKGLRRTGWRSSSSARERSASKDSNILPRRPLHGMALSSWRS